MITILAIWAFIAVAIAIFATVYLVLRIRNAHSEAALSEREHTQEEEAYRLAKARLIHRRALKFKKDDPQTSIFGMEVPTHLRMD